MTVRRVARLALAALILAVAACAGILYWLSHSGRPIREGTLGLYELAEPVSVRFDAWAVPHVEARTGRDLAMAIGWLHANERMVQMELGRRAAFGRLAEILGEEAVPLDRRALELRLGASALRMVESLSVEHRGVLEAYALGVNSWLQRRGGDLPPELRALRVTPEPWRVADSLGFLMLLSRDLSYPQVFEESRWQWLSRAGLERLRGLGGSADLALDPLLEAYLREHPAGKPGPGPAAEMPHGGAAAPGREEGATAGASEGRQGSNSWALGSTRTKSEAPLVANDPHLPIGAPSLWYQALLRSPDYEAMGMTLPGLPLVVIGQNAHVAWSFTNTELDTNDLFIEELSPDGKAVRRGERFVPLTRESTTIPVRGGEDVTLELLSSDLGPFFAADPERGLPPRSLAWTAHIPFDPLNAFFGLARARSVAELPQVCEDFLCPVQNLVAADRRGGLLFMLLGRVPERGAGDGRLPLAAWNASNHWRGLRPADQNPRIDAPPDDLLVTANQDIRPPGYALALPAEFDMPFRAQRVRERLLARGAWWPADVADLQGDALSLYARRLLESLPQQAEGEAGLALKALAVWDCTMDLTGESALFALFERELFAAVYGDELEHFGLRSLPGYSRGEALLAALDGSLAAPWFDDLRTKARVETREEQVERALTRAWREGHRLFGANLGTWNYGELHSWTARHPLDALPFGERFLNRGPMPVRGSPTTIAAFGGRWRDGRMEVTHGPSMRWVGDCGDPDRSRCVLPLGQSGHPADAHYDDQLPIFLVGKTHDMHWSEASIAKATVSTLILQP